MIDPTETERLNGMLGKHRDRVVWRLRNASARIHALFSLACAERFLPTVYVYSLVTKDHVEPFFLWTQSLCQLLIESEEIPILPLTLLQDIQCILPDEDEHPTQWTEPAHYAVWCLWHAIHSLSDHNLNYPVWSAEYALYIANHVTKITWEQTGRVEPEPAYSDVFFRELDKQLEDMNFLTTKENLTPEKLHQWRFDNRGFAIPVMLPTL